MSWSSGKDSTLALHEIRSAGEVEVVGLLTTVNTVAERVAMHGVRRDLLEAQAEALGLPLHVVELPWPCPNGVYEEQMAKAIAEAREAGVEIVGFGDLFLEDLRTWREGNLARVGMTGVFPIWKRETGPLARQVIAMGFRAILSCVEGKVGPGFVGRDYDERLLADLPEGIDPCGEYGEFHSFVHDGPCFARPVPVTVGEIVVRDGRYYADLLLGDPAASTPCAARDMPPV